MLKTPTIFLTFNRPLETQRVFDMIRKAQPSKLFIVADGPRNDEEKKLTDSVRAIYEHIDWPCEVYRDYSEVNLGCRKRVASGISWAMNQLENDTDGAIILEDDCLPDQSFFSYCEEMLERHKNTNEIMHIGGTNFQENNSKFTGSIGHDSYYFSHIAQIWGWATWKRAWKLYDSSMSSWGELKGSQKLISSFPNRLTYDYWANHFQRLYENKTNTWDIAWTYTCYKEHGLCIMPKINLVENIGNDIGATHKASAFSNIKTSPLIFPLSHPIKIEVNEIADAYTYRTVFGIRNTPTNSLKALIKSKLPFMFEYIKRLMK